MFHLLSFRVIYYVVIDNWNSGEKENIQIYQAKMSKHKEKMKDITLDTTAEVKNKDR